MESELESVGIAGLLQKPLCLGRIVRRRFEPLRGAQRVARRRQVIGGQLTDPVQQLIQHLLFVDGKVQRLADRELGERAGRVVAVVAIKVDGPIKGLTLEDPESFLFDLFRSISAYGDDVDLSALQRRDTGALLSHLHNMNLGEDRICSPVVLHGFERDGFGRPVLDELVRAGADGFAAERRPSNLLDVLLGQNDALVIRVGQEDRHGDHGLRELDTHRQPVDHDYVFDGVAEAAGLRRRCGRGPVAVKRELDVFSGHRVAVGETDAVTQFESPTEGILGHLTALQQPGAGFALGRLDPVQRFVQGPRRRIRGQQCFLQRRVPGLVIEPDPRHYQRARRLGGFRCRGFVACGRRPLGR